MLRRAPIAVLLLTACAEGGEPLDPFGDEDGDGFANGEETRLGADPFDADDVPYLGGWVKSPCGPEHEATGNAVGEVATNFVLQDQHGQDWSLHDFCDAVLLLEFSGFTCSSCTANAPGLEQLLRIYGEDGLLPVMVMYDATPESARAFAEEKDLSFPVLSDPSGALFARWDPSGDTPSTTILDRWTTVWSIDRTWYLAMLEEVLYGEEVL